MSISSKISEIRSNLPKGVVLVAVSKFHPVEAIEEAYAAEQAAEEARRAKEQATLEADIIVRAETRKRELELAAEAEAEQMKEMVRGASLPHRRVFNVILKEL